MDKIDALKISKQYLNKLQSMNIQFSEAWLFGSYCKGNQTEDSDIDLAIVLSSNTSNDFNTTVQLMSLRDATETIIEPHTFTYEEFISNLPIVRQIHLHGEKIQILRIAE